MVESQLYGDRDAFEAALQARLEAHHIEFVCLAGFMRILSAPFVERWRGRILNIHPSLLPALRGLNTHERALAAGLSEHGCTVHFVEPELDAGPIVAQTRVPVLPDDDAEQLAARVLAEEHKLYPARLGRGGGGSERGGRARGPGAASADHSLPARCAGWRDAVLSHNYRKEARQAAGRRRASPGAGGWQEAGAEGRQEIEG